MEHYELLTAAERECVEIALDQLIAALRFEGVHLGDGGARAAEALARWIVESR